MLVLGGRARSLARKVFSCFRASPKRASGGERRQGSNKRGTRPSKFD